MLKIEKMKGDLVIPAENADSEAVNFMAKNGRGLICLTLTEERVEELGLKLMSSNNKSRHETALLFQLRQGRVLLREYLQMIEL